MAADAQRHDGARVDSPSEARVSEGETSAVMEGDVAAFEALFRAEYNGLCDFAEQYVHSAAVAEEMVQNVFLRIWKRRDTLSPTDVSRPYLYAAVRNAVFQHVRRERLHRRWQEGRGTAEAHAATGEPADATAHARELAVAAGRAVADLPERCRLVFTLSRYQGLRNAEIAAMLGISVGTVEVQMTRALKTLAAKLAPYLAIILIALS